MRDAELAYGVLVVLAAVLAVAAMWYVGMPGLFGDTGAVAQDEPDGHLSDTGDLANANVTFAGNASGDAAGFDVAAVEDLDGDGHRDVVVTAPFVVTDGTETATRPGADAGAAYVFYGPVSDATFDVSEADVVLYGAAGDRAGTSIAAGDLTGSPASDLVVGAPYNDTNGENSGVVYVVEGGDDLPERVDLAADADVVYEGGDAEAYGGYDVATVPDRNATRDDTADTADDAAADENSADGGDGLLVGAPYANTTGDGAGAVYLVEVTTADGDGDRGRGLASAASVTYVGADEGDGAGWAVADAGDVTGDGAHEVVVGAPFNDTAAGGNAGAAYVLSTQPEDGDAVDSSALDDGGQSVDPDASVVVSVDEGLSLQGPGARDRAGFAVSTAGNVTDDDVDSLVVGAPYNDTVDAHADGDGPAVDAGAAYVVHGDPAGELEGARSLADADATLYGESANDRAGWSVGGGTELVCDGRADVVVGAPYANATDTHSGAAYVVTGGQLTADDAVERALSPRDGRFDGAGAYDRAGWAVAPANDSTGDNTHDVLVGAPYNTTAEARTGAAYVVSGDCPVRPEEPVTTPEPTPTAEPGTETPTRTPASEPTQTPDRGPADEPIPDPPDPTPTPTPEPDPTPTPTSTPTSTPPDEPDGAITECTTIDEPGEYQLTSDLEEREEDVCIEITSGEVVLEGNDHLVEGVGAEDSVGVQVNVSHEGTQTEESTVVIRDLQVENWHDGVVESSRGDLKAVSLEGITARDNEQHGVQTWRSSPTVDFVDVTASGNGGMGINTFDTNVGVLHGVAAEDNGGDGIHFFDAGEIDVEDVTVAGNDGTGMDFGQASYAAGRYVTATDNGEYGIRMILDASVDFDESTVAGNDGSGIRVGEDTDLTLRNSVVENNGEHGIVGWWGSVELDNTSLRENAGWELYNETNTQSTASDLSIGDAAVLDFDEERVSLDAVPEDELPATPEDAEAVGDGVEAEGIEDSVTATLQYDVDRVEGEEVELWRYDGASWESVGTYEADGTITEELTADGTYAPVDADGDGGNNSIGSCTTIDEPGAYELTTDLEDRDEAVCLEITAGNVVLEGNGHLVDGVGGEDTVGVQVVAPEDDEIDNVTVRNLRVENWHDGVVVGTLESGSEAVDLEGVEAIDNERHGVVAWLSKAALDFVEVTASQNGGSGIYAFEANVGEMTSVTAEDNGEYGIYFRESEDVDVDDVTAAGNGDHGFALADLTRLGGADVTATDNGGHGISIGTDSRVDLEDSTIANNEGAGISASDGGVTLRNSVVENNGEDGIWLTNALETELEAVTLRGNDGWELHSDFDEPVTATDLGIGDSAAFDLDDEGVSLEAVPEDELPATPEDAEAVGDGVEAEGIEDSVTATLEYDPDRVEGETVELWRHDGDDWESVGTYDADGGITEELTSDGVYAPVETDDTTEQEGTVTPTP